MSRTRLTITIGGAWLLTPPLAAGAPPLHSNEGARIAPPLIRSARSGLWSAPGTWERGQVPDEGARVQIRAGDRVTYDRDAAAPIRSIHVAGMLAFARDRDTRLDVGLIKIQPGNDTSENGFDCDASTHFVGTRPPADPSRPRPTLEVGTAQQPIDPHHTAHIRLVYFPSMDRLSCPAIVCCGGRMELHGAPMSRTWVKLGITAPAGVTVVTLAEPVSGWRVGDHLVLTATQRTGSGSKSGTFRPNHGPLRPADGQVSPPANDPTQAALAAAEARLMAEIVPKFVFIRPDAPSMIVENMDIYGSRYGIFQPIYDHHAYHGLTINQTEVPGGHPFITIGQVPDGLEFKDAQDRGRLPSGAAVEKRLGAGEYLPGRAISKALTTSPPGEAKPRLVKQSADPLAEPSPEAPSAPLSSTAFPRPLDPVDDLPPATVITFTRRSTDGRLVVLGTTSDNGTVRRVLVNGQEARPLAPNFSEWEIALDKIPGVLSACPPTPKTKPATSKSCLT